MKRISHTGDNPKWYIAGTFGFAVAFSLFLFILMTLNDVEYGGFSIACLLGFSIGVVRLFLTLRYYPEVFDVDYDDSQVYIRSKSGVETFPIDSVVRIGTKALGAFGGFFKAKDLMFVDVETSDCVTRRHFIGRSHSRFDSSIDAIPFVKDFRRAVLSKKD